MRQKRGGLESQQPQTNEFIMRVIYGPKSRGSPLYNYNLLYVLHTFATI